MCIGIPMKIVEFDPDFGMATGEVDGVTREINVSLLDPAELSVGTWVLVHAGFGVTVVDENFVSEARSAIAEIDAKTETPFATWETGKS